jgi:hypothetical protein
VAGDTVAVVDVLAAVVEMLDKLFVVGVRNFGFLADKMTEDSRIDPKQTEKSKTASNFPPSKIFPPSTQLSDQTSIYQQTWLLS